MGGGCNEVWMGALPEFSRRMSGANSCHLVVRPAARDSHSAVWSPTADGMYIFGGNSFSDILRVMPEIMGSYDV